MATQRKDRILLVDDEKNLLISLTDFLVHQGFDVVVARSGEEALKRCEQDPPDLIVLDMSMPGMGGIGFIKQISDKSGTLKYPVIVLTARAQMKDFFSNLAVDGFISKPCDEDALVRKIREVLTAKRSRAVKETRPRRLVLLAEDDSGPRASLVLKLEHAGYDVAVADSGPAILEKAVACRPDIFLLKEILPGLNGSAAVNLLAVMPSLKDVPTVVYDEHANPTTAQRLKAVPIVKAVVPSSDSESLLAALRRLD